ncbi:MAG: hypothetical protein IJ301_00995 [Clostridia bacterium]|nr:hypothetical protein [Clostridia bacterium]
MISMMGDFFSSLINSIRTMDDTLRGVIMLGLVLFSFFFLALSINKGKNHQEKPMKWGFFILAIVCFAVAVVFTILL